MEKTLDLLSLDDEINIFDDGKWDFFDIANTQLDIEFFNEFEDVSNFLSNKIDFVLDVAKVIAMFSLVVVLGLGVVKGFGVFDKSGVTKIENEVVAPTVSHSDLTYVSGADAEDSELIEISKLLNSYFSVYKNQSDYDQLNQFCSDNVSQTDLLYSDTLGEMVGILDNNDCFARSIKVVNSEFRVNRINKVVCKDSMYYCYVSMVSPSVYSMPDYIFMHEYNLVKYFNTHTFNKDEVSRFFLDTIMEDGIPCEEKEYCVVCEKQDGVFKIQDDSEFADLSKVIYSSSIKQITQIMRGILKS